GDLSEPTRLANLILNALLSNKLTRNEMRRALVNAFSSASSFANARLLCRIVIKITDFTDDEKQILQRACIQNEQVEGATRVPEPIFAAFGKPAEAAQIHNSDAIPF